MIIKNSMLANIIHRLNLDCFLKSQKRLWNDNRGGFLIPVEAKIADEEYKKYRHLPINWSIPSITKEVLPTEFSQKAVNTVDMFKEDS